MATNFGILSFVSFDNKLVINCDELSEGCLERGSEFVETNYHGSLGTIWRPRYLGMIFDCEIFIQRDGKTVSLARFDKDLDKWLITDKWGIRRQFSWLKMEHLGLKDGDKLQLINLNED